MTLSCLAHTQLTHTLLTPATPTQGSTGDPGEPGDPGSGGEPGPIVSRCMGTVAIHKSFSSAAMCIMPVKVHVVVTTVVNSSRSSLYSNCIAMP